VIEEYEEADLERRELLQGLAIMTPTVYSDDRGHFIERFNLRRFIEVTGERVEFVQDNQSRSVKGVVRGLHYQLPPSGQGKLVSCLRGTIFDVAVDIRRSSSSFGAWFGVILSERNLRQLWIPVGFAHGFVSLEESTDVLYKTTAYYDAGAERSIRWDDPAIAISWPDTEGAPILSDKDAAAPLLEHADVFA